MIFKKPYAFFIKYFRLINLFLVIALIHFLYRLNLLHGVLSDIFLGKLTNFSLLQSNYLGLRMYLVLGLIFVFLLILIMTLKRKNKPFMDYLFNIFYNIVLIAYFFAVSTLFSDLNEEIVEITSLKLYEDISFLIMVPMFYFIIKYILIVIGFDLKKFNFAKDIVEMKEDEKDNEEVEIIFGKNNYKIKRKIRKYFRELKYYVLENKMFISIISIVVASILFISFFSINLFNNNNVKLNKNFKVGTMSFKVNNIYETQYDYSNRIIKKDYKFVIADISVTNNYFEAQKVDFKRLRVFFGEEYVYANNYNNDYFNDLGIPYNNEMLNSNQTYNYLFIFKVPVDYKSNKYTIKFYDGLTTNKNDETIGNYKTLKCKASVLDAVSKNLEYELKENAVFEKNKSGSSNITFKSYSLENSYVYNNGTKDVIVYDKDINNTLLILDYKLDLNESSGSYQFIKNDNDFFSRYSSISFTLNKKIKGYNNLKILKTHDEKVIISVPAIIRESDEINFILNFRDKKIVYRLK